MVEELRDGLLSETGTRSGNCDAGTLRAEWLRCWSKLVVVVEVKGGVELEHHHLLLTGVGREMPLDLTIGILISFSYSHSNEH